MDISQTSPSIDNYRVIARPGRDLGRAMTARQDRSTRPRTCAQAARLPLYTVPGGRVIAMPTDFWWAFSKRQARETRNGADDGATLRRIRQADERCGRRRSGRAA